MTHCVDCGRPTGRMPRARRCLSCMRVRRTLQVKLCHDKPKRNADIEAMIEANLAAIRAARTFRLSEDDCYAQRGDYLAETNKRMPDYTGLPTDRELHPTHRNNLKRIKALWVSGAEAV